MLGKFSLKLGVWLAIRMIRLFVGHLRLPASNMHPLRQHMLPTNCAKVVHTTREVTPLISWLHVELGFFQYSINEINS